MAYAGELGGEYSATQQRIYAVLEEARQAEGEYHAFRDTQERQEGHTPPQGGEETVLGG